MTPLAMSPELVEALERLRESREELEALMNEMGDVPDTTPDNDQVAEADPDNGRY